MTSSSARQAEAKSFWYYHCVIFYVQWEPKSSCGVALCTTKGTFFCSLPFPGLLAWWNCKESVCDFAFDLEWLVSRYPRGTQTATQVQHWQERAPFDLKYLLTRKMVVGPVLLFVSQRPALEVSINNRPLCFLFLISLIHLGVPALDQ